MKAWILQNRFIGPPVRQWKDQKGISSASRISAVGSLLISFSVSIWFSRHHPLAYVPLGLGAFTLIYIILRIPVIENEDSP